MLFRSNHQRHKRKESLSVLLISNTGRENRQFNIPLPVLRIFPVLLCLLIAVTGWLAYEFSIDQKARAALQTQITTQEELVQQLTEEKEQLNNDKTTLSEENAALRQEIEQTKAEQAEAEAAEEEPEDPAANPAFPGRYPYSGASVLLSSYTEEQPYLSISTYTGGTVTAAGDGTVITLSSDDIYQHIIEIAHETGYTTRYLCYQGAETAVEEGAQVHAGDVLLNITADETRLDYQIIFEEAPLDPLSVIDARG